MTDKQRNRTKFIDERVILLFESICFLIYNLRHFFLYLKPVLGLGLKAPVKIYFKNILENNFRTILLDILKLVIGLGLEAHFEICF